MTSNSYHFTHVGFILFRFQIIIIFELLPCVMSFTGCNSYLLHVRPVRSYSDQTYTYTMENRNRSESYQIHTGSNHTYIDTYQIRTLVHNRYRSQQIHIPDSYRFRTDQKINRFIGLYHNHIRTYTYSC